MSAKRFTHGGRVDHGDLGPYVHQPVTAVTLEYLNDFDHVQTFRTTAYTWDGLTWNGFPAPIFPKWVSFLVTLLIGEQPETLPHLETIPDKAGEPAYERKDGLQWEIDTRATCAHPACKAVYWSTTSSASDRDVYCSAECEGRAFDEEDSDR